MKTLNVATLRTACVALSNAGYNEEAFNLLVFANPPDLINITAGRVLQDDNATVSFAVRAAHTHIQAVSLPRLCTDMHHGIYVQSAIFTTADQPSTRHNS